MTAPDGRRIRTSTKATTPKAARVAAMEIRDRIARRAYEPARLASNVTTLGAALGAYVALLRGRGSPSANNIATLAAKAVGTHPTLSGPQAFALSPNKLLHEITAADIQALCVARMAAGNAPQTVAHEIKTIRAACRHAKRMGFMPPDIDCWSIPKLPTKTRYLSRAEFARLLEVLDPDRPILSRAGNPYKLSGEGRKGRQDARDLAIFLAFTGARWSEAAGLRWDQVDMEAGEVRLWGSKTQRERIVPLPAVVMEVLRRRYTQDRGALVFPGRANGERGGTSHAIRKAMDEAGLNDPAIVARYGRATIHTLRHSYASWLLQGGADLSEVQEALGHATMTMTRRYAHLSRSRTVARLRAVLDTETGATP